MYWCNLRDFTIWVNYTNCVPVYTSLYLGKKKIDKWKIKNHCTNPLDYIPFLLLPLCPKIPLFSSWKKWSDRHKPTSSTLLLLGKEFRFLSRHDPHSSRFKNETESTIYSTHGNRSSDEKTLSREFCVYLWRTGVQSTSDTIHEIYIIE